MDIKIYDAEKIIGDQEAYMMISDCVARAIGWVNAANNNTAQIDCNCRRKDGWLEFGLHIFRSDGHRLIYIAVIQRTPGAPFEGHS